MFNIPLIFQKESQKGANYHNAQQEPVLFCKQRGANPIPYWSSEGKCSLTVSEAEYALWFMLSDWRDISWKWRRKGSLSVSLLAVLTADRF